MNEFFERITNLRQLDYEQQIQKIVDTQLQTVLDELATHALDQDLTGLCKILASNIQADLQQVGIQARLLDFNKLSGVDPLVINCRTPCRKLYYRSVIQAILPTR